MSKIRKNPTDSNNSEKLLAAQLYVQNNLDQDLSLDVIARHIGLSASHFHRLFRAGVGETLKQYSDRLRVEKSLYDIRISNLNLLEISLRYGFKHPGTFTRTFNRHFGFPPSHYLRERTKTKAGGTRRTDIEFGLRHSKSNNFTITRHDDIHLAFIRHLGKYEDVPLFRSRGNNPWRDLERFALIELKNDLPKCFIGIPQDDPSTTSEDKLRFDMCLMIEEPFEPQGAIGYAKIEAGYCGVLTHAGPYETLSDAYSSLFKSALESRGFEITPAPVFELMLDISATTIADHTWTELYIPLKKRGIN